MHSFSARLSVALVSIEKLVYSRSLARDFDRLMRLPIIWHVYSFLLKKNKLLLATRLRRTDGVVSVITKRFDLLVVCFERIEWKKSKSDVNKATESARDHKMCAQHGRCEEEKMANESSSSAFAYS